MSLLEKYDGWKAINIKYWLQGKKAISFLEGDWYNLQFVPEALRTPELCEIACEQDWYALRFVPESVFIELENNLKLNK